MARRPYRKKERRRPLKGAALEERRKADARIEEALRATGHAGIKAFLLARTIVDGRARTLVELAEELGVPSASFISYHARWIDQEAKATI